MSLGHLEREPVLICGHVRLSERRNPMARHRSCRRKGMAIIADGVQMMLVLPAKEAAVEDALYDQRWAERAEIHQEVEVGGVFQTLV